MRVRPKLTIERVFKLHENIERNHPPGSEHRGAVLESAHQYLLQYARVIRQLRQLPVDRRKFNLFAMVLLDERTMGKRSFRDLAKEALGRKATDGSIDRLARKYSQHLRDYPSPDQGAGHRFDGVAREFRRECAVVTAAENALAECLEELDAPLTKG